MFEQSFENDDRYLQQGRRSYSPYSERRGSRGFQSDDDRYEGQDRYRFRNPDSDRRYTRPDYDSDLDIERPGQARFGSRGSSDYGREHDQEGSWQRPYRSQRFSDRYEGGNRMDSNRAQSDFGRGFSDYNRQSDYGRGMSDYGRGMSDYGRGMSDYGRGMSDYGRGTSDYGRDWQVGGSGLGHADWNRYGSGEQYQGQGWNRHSFDQQQTHFNDQKNRWPKSYKRSDERLKDDIHEELIRHGRIDASDIEVQVKDGEVTLTGSVVSRQDKRIAEELAEKVLGVHDVQNQLRVHSQQSQSQSQNQGQSSDQLRSMSGSSLVSSTSGTSASSTMAGSSRPSATGQQQQDQNRSAGTTGSTSTASK
jgi:hypothetical protein